MRDIIVLLSMAIVTATVNAAPLTMHDAVITCNKQTVLDFLESAHNPEKYYFFPTQSSNSFHYFMPPQNAIWTSCDSSWHSLRELE